MPRSCELRWGIGRWFVVVDDDGLSNYGRDGRECPVRDAERDESIVEIALLRSRGNYAEAIPFNEMARPSEPLIDRDRVIRAAVVLLDRHGPGGLSMRALASQLNVSAPSLYHHFRNKDEILEGVARWIFLETRIVPRADDEWMSSLADQATALVEVILDHPNALPILITAPYRHFDFRMHEFSASHMVQAGVPYERIIPFFEGMYALAVGLASTILHSGLTDQFVISDNTPHMRRALDAPRQPLLEQIRSTFTAFISGWISEAVSQTGVAQPSSARRTRSG